MKTPRPWVIFWVAIVAGCESFQLEKFSEKNETEQNTNETTVKDELSSKSKEALLNKEQGVGDEFTRSLSKIEQNAIGTRLGFDYQRHIRFFVNDKKGKYVPGTIYFTFSEWLTQKKKMDWNW